MDYSKQYLENLSKETGFIRDNLEKVLRLVEVLKFLNSDQIFKDKLALKGGTSINMTVMRLPRLSVDIDLDFTENLSKEEVMSTRKVFSDRLISYMSNNGYSMMAPLREHYALHSFTFSYKNNAGNRDNIKVEMNFMDRCHILPLEHKDVICEGIIEPFSVLTLNRIELYASKINALLSRSTPRDLYDVNNMIENEIIEDDHMLRKCLVFYNMVGGEQDLNDVSFTNIENISFMRFKTQLRPVLSKRENFDLGKAKANTIMYLKRILVLTCEERRFIDNFRRGIYIPELLFDDQRIINMIKMHPMALWRIKKITSK